MKLKIPESFSSPQSQRFLPFTRQEESKQGINEDNLNDAISENNLLATIILESYNDSQYTNEQRFNTIKSCVRKLNSLNFKNGIIIFPAGMFFTGKEKPSSLYPEIQDKIANLLSSFHERVVICFGIDGGLDSGGYAQDQIAIAIDKAGIIALGRKFFPQKKEIGHVILAKSFNEQEDGKSRIFTFKDDRYYLAMCYDSFGIKKQKIQSPGVNGIIEFAHCFYPKGMGPSGAEYFARHGFGGASRQWNCPVFGTGVFFFRPIPEKWPTGVMWNKGSMSTRNWKYEMNTLHPINSFHQEIDGVKAITRLFLI